jgi:hypothetical protein
MLRALFPQAGPAAESNSTSAMWLYRSLVDQQAHANAGLFGETCHCQTNTCGRAVLVVLMSVYSTPSDLPQAQ